jgi:flagellar biosynthesis/type III secretory pathway protein FliH
MNIPTQKDREKAYLALYYLETDPYKAPSETTRNWLSTGIAEGTSYCDFSRQLVVMAQALADARAEGYEEGRVDGFEIAVNEREMCGLGDL